jgi:hypothetical protein
MQGANMRFEFVGRAEFRLAEIATHGPGQVVLFRVVVSRFFNRLLSASAGHISVPQSFPKRMRLKVILLVLL